MCSRNLCTVFSFYLLWCSKATDCGTWDAVSKGSLVDCVNFPASYQTLLIVHGYYKSLVNSH